MQHDAGGDEHEPDERGAGAEREAAGQPLEHGRAAERGGEHGDARRDGRLPRAEHDGTEGGAGRVLAARLADAIQHERDPGEREEGVRGGGSEEREEMLPAAPPGRKCACASGPDLRHRRRWPC